MRINSFSFLLAPLALAAAALTTQPAMASSHVVHVPFNFVAGGEQCPAGNYQIREDNRGATVVLSGGRHTFVWILFPGDGDLHNPRVVLTFDVAGQKHTLRSVQYGGLKTARIDKKEKESIPAVQQISVGL